MKLFYRTNIHIISLLVSLYISGCGTNRFQYAVDGQDLEARGDYAGAAQAYLAGAEVSISDNDIRNASYMMSRRGDALANIQKYAEAVAAYNESLRLFEKSKHGAERAYYATQDRAKVAEIYYKTNQSDKFIVEINSIIEFCRIAPPIDMSVKPNYRAHFGQCWTMLDNLRPALLQLGTSRQVAELDGLSAQLFVEMNAEQARVDRIAANAAAQALSAQPRANLPEERAANAQKASQNASPSGQPSTASAGISSATLQAQAVEEADRRSRDAKRQREAVLAAATSITAQLQANPNNAGSVGRPAAASTQQCTKSKEACAIERCQQRGGVALAQTSSTTDCRHVSCDFSKTRRDTTDNYANVVSGPSFCAGYVK